MIKPLTLAAAAVLITIQPDPQPLPEVWLGDRTNACITIIYPGQPAQSCPEDKSDIPQPHTPIYVIEETQP